MTKPKKQALARAEPPLTDEELRAIRRLLKEWQALRVGAAVTGLAIKALFTPRASPPAPALPPPALPKP